MTRISIELPEALAERAQEKGLFQPEQVERLFKEELRRRAGERLLEIGRMPTDKPPMSEEEVQKEVDAVRALRRKQHDAARP